MALHWSKQDQQVSVCCKLRCYVGRSGSRQIGKETIIFPCISFPVFSTAARLITALVWRRGYDFKFQCLAQRRSIETSGTYSMSSISSFLDLFKILTLFALSSVQSSIKFIVKSWEKLGDIRMIRLRAANKKSFSFPTDKVGWNVIQTWFLF